MLGVVEHEAEDEQEAEDEEVEGRSLLDEIARESARHMLLAAPKRDVAAYREAHAADRDTAGHALVVPNGKGRTRKVTSRSGTIAARILPGTFGSFPHIGVFEPL